TRLVLRPSVESRFAELLVRALLVLRDCVARVAPAVVVVDRVGECAVVVTVAVGRRAARQPQADVTLALRVAETKTRDREYQVGQIQDRRDLVDLVTDDADGTHA